MNKINYSNHSKISFKTVENPQITQQNNLQEQQFANIDIPDIYKNNITNSVPDFKESMKKADMMNIITPWFEHPLLMIGTCLGLSLGVDKFSNACSGEYEKSLVGKVSIFGDKIQNSKIFQSNTSKNFFNKVNGLKSKLKNLFSKSDYINAVTKTPSQPEWRFVKDEMLNMQQRIVHDFTRITETLKLTNSEVVKISNLGISKKERELAKEFFNGTIPDDIKFSNFIQLKRLNLTDDEIKKIVYDNNATSIVKDKTLEKLGIDKKFIEKISKETIEPDDIEKVLNACKNNKDVKISVGHNKMLGPFQIIERNIGADQIRNRLSSIIEAKTATGKAFATFLQKCHRGFTFGGGKGGVLLFVAPHIVETIIDVKKAEPKEKVGTGVFGMVSAMSWVFTFPIALKIMHHIAGSQYAGMKPENVKEYRKLISEFNEKANPFKTKSWKNMFNIGEKKADGTYFKTYEEFKNAKNELKTKLKNLCDENITKQSLFTKISKKLSKFLTIDLETISSFKNGSIIGNISRSIPNFLKNVGGIPMRFIAWGCISMGVLDTIINKTIKGCFGNYYDRYKEEEFIENKKKQKEFTKNDLVDRLYEKQADKIYGVLNKENNFEIPEKIKETLAEEKFKQTINEKIKQNKIVENKNEKIDNLIINDSEINSESIQTEKNNNEKVKNNKETFQ